MFSGVKRSKQVRRSVAGSSFVFASIGYFAGEVFSRIVDDLHRYEKWIAAALLLVGAIVLYLRWHGARQL